MRFLLLCSLWLATALLPAAEPPVIRVWPGQPPGDESFQPPGPATKAAPPRSDDTLRLTLVTEPTLTLFRAPADRANGAAVVICPGGGYNLLAWDKEGTEVAQWLNSLGVTAAVLQYRVPRRDPVNPHAAPLQDAQRALRLVRLHARDWGVDVQRVGILGFSAGGHLAVMAGTHWDRTTYAKLDAADDLSCRPDFLIPIYPAYLGDENKPGPLSPLVRVTKETPPTFIAVTQDDKLRGLNAASFYIELQKAKVPAELHIYTQGGHGYGLRPSEHPVSRWPERCADWLRAMKIIPVPKP
jgi:acetyl esterase/lipase